MESRCRPGMNSCHQCWGLAPIDGHASINYFEFQYNVEYLFCCFPRGQTCPYLQSCANGRSHSSYTGAVHWFREVSWSPTAWEKGRENHQPVNCSISRTKVYGNSCRFEIPERFEKYFRRLEVFDFNWERFLKGCSINKYEKAYLVEIDLKRGSILYNSWRIDRERNVFLGYLGWHQRIVICLFW